MDPLCKVKTDLGRNEDVNSYENVIRVSLRLALSVQDSDAQNGRRSVQDGLNARGAEQAVRERQANRNF